MTFPWISLRKLFRGREEGTRRAARPRKTRLTLELLEDRLALSATGIDALDAEYALWRAQTYSIEALSTPPSISVLDELGSLATPAGDLIGLDPVFANYSYRGTGYSVVIIDTGIDYRHSALGAGWGNRVIAGWDFANNDADPMDDNGHGTHVAGIIGSSSTAYSGIAPDVNLIALKVLDANGSGSFGAVEDALKWVVANQARYNIAAVNLSLGAGNFTVNPYTFLEDEFAALNNQGVFIAAASGNSFYSFNSQPGLGYPAISPLTVSVGAVWSSNVGSVSWFNGARDYTTAADRITSFTQRSSQLNILAPGAMITSTYLNNTYVSLSGTSMAAPAIAGAAVLIHQALDATGNAAIANQQTILGIMQSTGVAVNDGDDENDNVVNTGLNFKRLDLYAALNSIESANQPPTLAPIANQRMSSTQDVLIVTLFGSDPDGEVLTYSARTLPGTSTPQVQYRLGGTQLTIDPPAGYVGSFQVEVTVSDGKATAATTFTVTVDAAPNAAPVLDAIADQTLTAGQAKTITLSASDPNSDALSFTARTLSASNSLYQLDQQLGLSYSGSYNTNLLRLGEKWLLGNNSQWYILLPNGELRRWLGTISASQAANALVQKLPTAVHTDPSLLWNAQQMPVVSYSFTGSQFTMQVQPGFVGSFVVEVTVSDGALSVSRTFTVTVAGSTTNSAPVLGAIPNQQTSFGQQTLVVSLPASDPDGDTLSYSARVTSASNQLYLLKQQLGLSSGTYNTNLLRLGEKWLQGKSQWYILLPNGELRRWAGTVTATMKSTALVTKLPTQVYTDPSLLWNAVATPAVTFSFSGNQLTMKLPAGFLGSFTVEVTASDGSQSVTGSFVTAVTATTSSAAQTGSQSAAADSSMLAALDKKLGLEFKGSHETNKLGLNEKWLVGNDNRSYILLPSGQLREWKGSLAKTLSKESLVAVVGTGVYADPKSLWNAWPQV